jgi:hypothetical protein
MNQDFHSYRMQNAGKLLSIVAPATAGTASLIKSLRLFFIRLILILYGDFAIVI